MLNSAAVPQSRAFPPIRLVSRNDAPRATRCGACNLHALCLPCGLDAGETMKLGDLVYTRKRAKRGEALVRPGADFESLYAIRTGFFKSSVMLEDGRDQVTGFHMAGEIVGMDGICTGKHMSGLVALEDSEVCVLPYHHMDDPDVQRQLQKVMSRELVREQGMMALLGRMRADERLAAFLVDLSQRFISRGFSSSEFHLRMTRDEIGSYLGLSIETVSRLFTRFHDEGLIEVQQKHVRIRDLPALRSTIFHP